MRTIQHSKKLSKAVLIFLILTLLLVYNCHLYSILMQSQQLRVVQFNSSIIHYPLTFKLHEKLSFMYTFLYNKNVSISPKALSFWTWTPRNSLIESKQPTQCTLNISPLELSNGGITTVSWNTLCVDKMSTFLFLYCPSISPDSEFIDYWPLSDLNPEEMRVALYNVRTDCQFRLIHNTTTATEVVGVSQVVSFIDANSSPEHGRLALTGSPQEMRVQWTSGAKYQPTVRYGLHPTNLEMTLTGSSHTYSINDLCGPPANLSAHFINPGQLHEVLLTNLKPSTKYFYQYGNINYKFSSVKSFTTAPLHGSNSTVKFAILGDMDIAPYPASEATVSYILRDISSSKTSFIMHVGDMSYAAGLAYRWEEWMTMIEPISSAVPYMVGIGNHEMDSLTGGEKDPSKEPPFHPYWGNYLHDSGGECGVPLVNRFHMPDNGNGLFWYTFTYGVVLLIQLSSEHDYAPGSHQYLWLVDVLKKIDRLQTPWVIATSHRPMYCSLIYYEEEIMVSDHIRGSLEALLVQHSVDLFVAGHYHVYERTCQLNCSKCDSAQGMVHLVVGTGGTHLDRGQKNVNDWSLRFEVVHGYGRVTANRTSLVWEFVSNDHGDVIDTMIFNKD